MEKLDRLVEIIRSRENVVIAFSGGTDSTLLAAAAVRAGVPALAVTADSPLLPPRELRHAREVARRLGLEHRVVEAGEWELPEVRGNALDRCYHCKHLRFELLRELARREGYHAVIEGTQADDLGQHRPGLKAVKELEICSPLLEAGMNKGDIHDALRELGLEGFIQPSRSCLATRFPYDTILEREDMERIDGVEIWLEGKGVGQLRARWEGPGRLRIEAGPPDIERLASEPLRLELLQHLDQLGFQRISLDLRGYRSGSMDEPSG